MTRYQEIESYFCIPSHIQEVYGIELALAKMKYEQFVDSLEDETKRKLTNFILRDRPELSKNKNGQTDIAIVNSQIDQWYAEYKYELTPGKELLGKIKKFAQEELKNDPNKILEFSEKLACKEFKALLKD